MKEITLPSGKAAKVRDGKGRDLLNAQRIARSPEEVAYALIAELTEIDGKRVLYEDVLEMDIRDVLMLHMELLGNFQSPQLGTLSISASGQAGG